MNQQIEQIKDVAMGVVHGILASTRKPDVSFKRVFELEPGEGQELLVVGSVRRDRYDGHCIAILNPGLTLQELLQPRTVYSPATLTSLVAGHCDAMVQVQVFNKHPSLASCYQASRR